VENMVEQIQTGHRWQYNTALAHCMLDNKGCRHTRRMCNIYCFSMATMVTRMRLIATFICALPVLLIWYALLSKILGVLILLKKYLY